MALPPTIPTSFVPKQPVEMHPRHTESNGRMLMMASLGLAGVAILLSGAVFAYAHFLKGESEEKAAALVAAQQNVSQETVEGFLRLRNRLTSAEGVLGDHVLLSQYLDILESLTLETVRFKTLDVSVGDDRVAGVKMSGIAKNFNALAAQSAAFAGEKRIKQAIFSDISADENGVVSFSVTAYLDPRLVKIPSTVPAGWAPQAVTATTTPAVATSTPATTTPSATKPAASSAAPAAPAANPAAPAAPPL